MATALLEYTLETAYLPPTWKPAPVSVAGAALAAGGQALRWAAMLHAGTAFTHAVATPSPGTPPRPGHKLVTTGPYALARHPAYLGWAAWAVGTQVLLANPACCLLFAWLCARFFRDRIRVEEAGLRALFGEAYDAYARRTRTWLPGVP
jgi:protein-S-isoprenylcysteine O-methyltransferase